jgi:hypothetical protein
MIRLIVTKNEIHHVIADTSFDQEVVRRCDDFMFVQIHPTCVIEVQRMQHDFRTTDWTLLTNDVLTNECTTITTKFTIGEFGRIHQCLWIHW